MATGHIGTERAAPTVEATAVGTISWLAGADTTIVVPVYQRRYRWDIGGCEQLLADVRAVAGAGPRGRHFIGSILSSASDDGSGLVLIDGQQRLTTLMLLIAALQHTIQSSDPQLAAELGRVVAGPDGRTRLRPHEAWADVFESVVSGRGGGDAPPDSRFDDNYSFFRSQIGPEEAPRIWQGLQRLEHVAITLGAGANAQQIFASLNSTGEPLRDHELIHNYVLMGLSHAQQREIEDEYWTPIERNTGEAIGAFWRHYLVMTTGREAAGADHGVYGEFRQRFPRLDPATLHEQATRWREASEVYRTLMEPERERDAAVSRQLAFLATFGRAMSPLSMRAYLDWSHGELTRDDLVLLLERLQSLLLRRAVVGLPVDRLVARLVRARTDGPRSLADAIGRITPSDERMRVALKYNDLPHALYVLGRIAGSEQAHGLEIEHIFPLAPGAGWTGDGVRVWADYTEDEQNSHRALSQTLGNLTLLEQPLAEASFDAPFPEKRRTAYARSRVPLTSALALAPSWGTPQIVERTADLTTRFIEIWRRPETIGIDDDGLTPILDAVGRRGWPRGWEREFEYTEYRGEHWEVHDVRHLFHRVFARLWADARESVVAFSSRRGGPVYPSRAWNGQWEALDGEHHLYMGWDSRYMLGAVQGVLDEAGIAPEVFVKYSYIGAAM
jgi:hypothetical protein